MTTLQVRIHTDSDCLRVLHLIPTPQRQVREKDGQIRTKDEEIRAKDGQIQVHSQGIRSKNDQIHTKNAQIQAKDEELRIKDGQIRASAAELQQLSVSSVECVLYKSPATPPHTEVM